MVRARETNTKREIRSGTIMKYSICKAFHCQLAPAYEGNKQI